MSTFNIAKYYGGKIVTKEELKAIELKKYYSTEIDTAKYKNSTLIIIVTYTSLPAIKLSLACLEKTLKKSENTYAVILDNNSSPDIKEHLKIIRNSKIDIIFIPENLGKAIAVNNFGQKFINDSNLPETIVSIDPDIIFEPNDFQKMIDASKNIKKAGMIGMRFKKNSCNPEINLFFPEKKLKGKDGNIYKLKCPFMATVAGPIFAINGNVYKNVLKYRLFPKKFLATYGGDDSATYSVLRRKFINGYLQGTEVTHLRQGDHMSEELQNYISNGF
jgi:GT2 family glycosyltransferase